MRAGDVLKQVYNIFSLSSIIIIIIIIIIIPVCVYVQYTTFMSTKLVFVLGRIIIRLYVCIRTWMVCGACTYVHVCVCRLVGDCVVCSCRSQTDANHP